MIKIKDGFKGECFISLPEKLLEEYGNNALIGNLYIHKIGYFPRVKYHYVQKEQSSGYAMLIYCTDGKGWYEIGGKKYRIEKNQYVILPHDKPYSFGADEKDPWTIYWVHFKGRLISSFVPCSFIPGAIIPGEYSRMQDRISLFEGIYKCFAMGYIQEYMTYSSMCLYQFLSSFIYIEQFKNLCVSVHQEFSFSSKVIRYMQENIEVNLTLDQLATYFRYSPSHFSMLFYKETGVSPIHYFIRLKIQKACQYIELTDMKISEISIELGFGEPAYFSRIFSKVMGISPSGYREKESEHSTS